MRHRKQWPSHVRCVRADATMIQLRKLALLALSSSPSPSSPRRQCEQCAPLWGPRSSGRRATRRDRRAAYAHVSHAHTHSTLAAPPEVACRSTTLHTRARVCVCVFHKSRKTRPAARSRASERARLVSDSPAKARSQFEPFITNMSRSQQSKAAAAAVA